MSEFLIEEGTNYSILIDSRPDICFNRIRRISEDFIRQLPKDINDKLWRELESGVVLLETEAHMSMYIFAYGNMHIAKLNEAFAKLPFDQMPEEIEVIDWGCGQALATVALHDYMKANAIKKSIRTVTLIEPSDLAIKRAALHVKKVLPGSNIRTVKRKLDDVDGIHIAIEDNKTVLHLFSNILDVEGFSLEKLKYNIETNEVNNFFVCVSPDINEVRNQRIYDFVNSFESRIVLHKYKNKCWVNNWSINLYVFNVINLHDCELLYVPWDVIDKKSGNVDYVFCGYRKDDYLNFKNRDSVVFLSYRGSDGHIWGLINSSRELIVPIKYSVIFYKEFRVTSTADIETDYYQLFKPTAQDVGFYAVMSYGKMGYLNIMTKQEIDCVYDEADAFCEGRAIVRLNKKYGCIDINGKVIVPFFYDFIGRFKDGISLVKIDNLYGYIDLDGNTVIPVAYPYLSREFDGLIEFKKNDLYGVMNRNKVVIDPIYSMLAHYSGYFVFQDKSSNRRGLIDYEGNIVIKAQFDCIYNFSELYFDESVYEDYFYEFGYEILESIVDVNNNIFAVKENKFGVVNLDGTVLIDFIYDSFKILNKSENEFCYLVSIDELNGLIDGDGTILMQCSYKKSECNKFLYDLNPEYANSKMWRITYL